MTTAKKRIGVPITDEERIRLSGLLLGMQRRGLSGLSPAAGQRETLPPFIVRLALERAAQLEEEMRPARPKKR